MANSKDILQFARQRGLVVAPPPDGSNVSDPLRDLTFDQAATVRHKNVNVRINAKDQATWNSLPDHLKTEIIQQYSREVSGMPFSDFNASYGEPSRGGPEMSGQGSGAHGGMMGSGGNPLGGSGAPASSAKKGHHRSKSAPPPTTEPNPKGKPNGGTSSGGGNPLGGRIW